MNKKLKLDELNRKSIDEFKNSEKIPVVVVLDNIRSLHNIGSIFRTCDAFGIEALYLCGITATPPHREINKTALGATESVDWNYFDTTIHCINELKPKGYKLISIEQTEQALPLKKMEFNANEKYALILGNEVDGVDQEVINLSDLTVELDQYGTKHSLNVSVCAGIILWEARKYF